MSTNHTRNDSDTPARVRYKSYAELRAEGRRKGWEDAMLASAIILAMVFGALVGSHLVLPPPEWCSDLTDPRHDAASCY